MFYFDFFVVLVVFFLVAFAFCATSVIVFAALLRTFPLPKALRTSIGIAKMIVLDWSEDTSLIVESVLKCNAPGEPANC